MNSNVKWKKDTEYENKKVDIKFSMHDTFLKCQDMNHLSAFMSLQKKDFFYYLGDRYDEAPRRRGLDEIDDFDTGHKNIAEEAVGKVKDLVNRVRGRHGPDDIVDYRYNSHLYPLPTYI